METSELCAILSLAALGKNSLKLDWPICLCCRALHSALQIINLRWWGIIITSKGHSACLLNCYPVLYNSSHLKNMHMSQNIKTCIAREAAKRSPWLLGCGMPFPPNKKCGGRRSGRNTRCLLSDTPFWAHTGGMLFVHVVSPKDGWP